MITSGFQSTLGALGVHHSTCFRLTKNNLLFQSPLAPTTPSLAWLLTIYHFLLKTFTPTQLGIVQTTPTQ